MKPLRHPFCLLALIAITFTCCTTQGQPGPEISNSADELPTRRQLSRSFWSEEKPQVVLVYPTGKLEADFKKIGETFKEKTKDFLRLSIKSCSEITAEECKTKPLITIGTPNANRVVSDLLNDLLLKITNGKIHFNNRQFEDASTVAILPFYPNPMNPLNPLTLITGLNDESIISFLENKLATDWNLFSWGNFDYEMYQNNRRVLLGFLDGQTWEIQHEVNFEFSKGSEVILETAHYRFLSVEHGHSKSSNDLEELAALSERAAQQIYEFTGTSKKLPKINHFLYTSTEQKGLMLHNTEHAHVNFVNREVHTVLNETYGGNFIGKENELIIRQLIGKPRTMALERGLAIYFSEKWQKQGFQYWAKRLYDSGNIIPLSDILDDEVINRGSRLLTGCLSASFVEFVIIEFGKENFLEKYNDWVPTSDEIQRLEKGWLAYLKKRPITHNPQPTTHNPQLHYLNGFNFAHEGYRIYNGYGSKRATQSLEKLVELGSNAVAIVPYGYMRNPNQATFIGITNRPGSENDESVIHSNAMAKKMGMSVMLKPQIWLHSSSWPGDVKMNSEEEWQHFFHYYHHWISHYAFMAEIYEMPMFCLGVEFAKSTLEREQDWRRLIKKIRGIYSGQLTYAANWGKEFENVSFWDELDFIGLNCYYPLANGENASKEELKKGFEGVVPKIETVNRRYKKPIVFTEIGFRSINAPWKHPHAGERRGAYNGEHQKRCYEAIFESIDNRKWCRGILWWKFPCDLSYRGVENGSFTPNKKPAEQVVKQWFSEKKN